MKRKSDRFFAMIACIAAIVFSSVFSAFAAEKIDITRECTLKIEYSCEGTPISGAKVSVYKFADLNKNAEVLPTETFSGYPVNFAPKTEKEQTALARTLAGYIKLDGIVPFDSGTTNKNGEVSFPNEAKRLTPGLYLAVINQHIQDEMIYKSEPFIVSLPNRDAESGSFLYEVSCEPKSVSETPESDTTKRKVLKIWKDDNESVRPKEVSVEILKDDELYQTVYLNKDNNWAYEWASLQKYNDDGTEIEWTIVENVPDGYNVLIEQETTTMVITNTYTPEDAESEITERSVQKVWDDKGYEKKRPKTVTVELLKNGTRFDSVVLSEENGWIYTWENLEKIDANGEYITWSINEKTVEGYTANIVLEGYTFVLTNSYDRPYIPRTGVLWWPIPMVAGAGMLFFTAGILLKKRNKDE